MESVEYKPYAVKDVLAKMKDMAMLSIDLAYAAILYNSKEIAAEVMELEREIDTHVYHLRMSAMLAARDADDAESLQSVMVIAHSTDKITDAVADIANSIIQGEKPHPIVLGGLRKMSEPLLAAKVEKGSKLIRKQVGDLTTKLKLSAMVVAVHRGREWVIDPSDSERIYEGDMLIARGSRTGITRLRDMCVKNQSGPK
jgi:uncharacterized protein with PhoU and TrkA domain